MKNKMKPFVISLEILLLTYFLFKILSIKFFQISLLDKLNSIGLTCIQFFIAIVLLILINKQYKNYLKLIVSEDAEKIYDLHNNKIIGRVITILSIFLVIVLLSAGLGFYLSFKENSLKEGEVAHHILYQYKYKNIDEEKYSTQEDYYTFFINKCADEYYSEVLNNIKNEIPNIVTVYEHDKDAYFIDNEINMQYHIKKDDKKVICSCTEYFNNETTEEHDNNVLNNDSDSNEYLVTNKEELLQTLVGTWEISERILYPRAYSQEAMEDCDRDYLGRTIDLQMSYFDGENFRINKPYYNFIATDDLYSFYLSPFGNFAGSELHDACKSDIETERYVLEILQNRKQEPDNSIYEQRKEYNGYHLDTGTEDELQYGCDECDIYCLLVIDKDTMLFDGGPLYRLKRVVK